MTPGPVTVSPAEDATILRVDDGKVNALTPELFDALGAGLDEAIGRGLPVVLTGNQKALSAGLHLHRVLDMDRSGLVQVMVGLHQTVGTILRAPVPVVAAIHGAAIAGGAVLAIACDHRVGHPQAVVGATENAVGIPFPPPLVPLLDQRLSPTTVTRTIFLARRLGGEEAIAAGWLDELSPEPVARAARVGVEMLGPHPEPFRRLKKERNARLLAAWPAHEKEWQRGGRYADYVDAFFAPGFNERVRASVARTLSKP